MTETDYVCGAGRGLRVRVLCELPVGHTGGHLGRGRAGGWFGWMAVHGPRMTSAGIQASGHLHGPGDQPAARPGPGDRGNQGNPQ